MGELTIELVPKTSWYSNVRSKVSKEKWDIIRKKCYRLANYKCEICGGKGLKWPVECHEIWDYDDVGCCQKLIAFISLCPDCHEVKHIGLANVRGRTNQAMAHLMKVNCIDEEEAEQEIQDAFVKWNERSLKEWNIDVEYIDKYIESIF